jgi:hypothetical protein
MGLQARNVVETDWLSLCQTNDKGHQQSSISAIVASSPLRIKRLAPCRTFPDHLFVIRSSTLNFFFAASIMCFKFVFQHVADTLIITLVMPRRPLLPYVPFLLSRVWLHLEVPKD